MTDEHFPAEEPAPTDEHRLKNAAEALTAAKRFADALKSVSIEAAHFAKDDPFCEHGTPCDG